MPTSDGDAGEPAPIGSRSISKTPAHVTPEPKPTAKNGAKAKTAIKPEAKSVLKAAAVTPPANKPLRIPATAVIHLEIDHNPKRERAGCRARFDLYKNGMTVAEYVAAGGHRADIPWDLAMDSSP